MNEQFGNHETVTVGREPEPTHKTCLGCGYCPTCDINPTLDGGVCEGLEQHVMDVTAVRYFIEELKSARLDLASLKAALGDEHSHGIGVALVNLARLEQRAKAADEQYDGHSEHCEYTFGRPDGGCRKCYPPKGGTPE